jgi:hypothetical protein
MSSTALFRTEAEPSGPVVVETSCSPVSLCVTDDFKGLEPLWEELERTARCTATHTYTWARAWARHGLGPQGGSGHRWGLY